MPIEAGKFGESEKKKKEITEKKIKEGNKKILEHKKIKEKISISIEADEKLASFRELILEGILTPETVEKIIAGENIDDETIQEMFEKIDQIEDVKNIDKYLPKDLRISKDDYKRAIKDDVFRIRIITKIDTALTILANYVSSDSAMGVNLFSGFLTTLDKNLILIQGNTIDIKDNLKEVDEQKNGKKKDNRTLWQKIIDFLKELFTN